MPRQDYDSGRLDLKTRLREALQARLPAAGLQKIATDTAYDEAADEVLVVVTVRRNGIKRSRLLRRAVNIGTGPARLALIASLRDELAGEFSA